MNNNANELKFIITQNFATSFHDKFREKSSSECAEKRFFLKATTIKEKYSQEELVVMPHSLLYILEKSYHQFDACKTMLVEAFCAKPAPKGQYVLDQAISLSNEMPERVIIVTDVPSEQEKIRQEGQLAMSPKEAYEELIKLEERLEKLKTIVDKPCN